MRKIGLGEVTREQVLIDRTLAEVAGERGRRRGEGGEGGWGRLLVLGAGSPPCSSMTCPATRTLLPYPRPRPPGTLLTARLALKHGLACNTAGGTHHAFPDHGSGYCILNDLAVAAEVLLAEKSVQRILILDLDVHQVGGWGGALLAPLPAAPRCRQTQVAVHAGRRHSSSVCGAARRLHPLGARRLQLSHAQAGLAPGHCAA